MAVALLKRANSKLFHAFGRRVSKLWPRGFDRNAILASGDEMADARRSVYSVTRWKSSNSCPGSSNSFPKSCPRAEIPSQTRKNPSHANKHFLCHIWTFYRPWSLNFFCSGKKFVKCFGRAQIKSRKIEYHGYFPPKAPKNMIELLKFLWKWVKINKFQIPSGKWEGFFKKSSLPEGSNSFPGRNSFPSGHTAG